MIDGPRPQKSLKSSFGHLWRQAPLWRWKLIGAGMFASVTFIYPPWQWGAATPSARGPMTSQNARHVAAAQPQSSAVLSPPQPIVSNKLPESVVHTAAPAQVRVEPQPVLKPLRPQAQTSVPPPPLVSRQGMISSQLFEADQNCNDNGPMRVRLNVPPPISGRVVGFLPPAIARNLITRSEQLANGKIDPEYTDNLRAVVHPSGAPYGVRTTAIVPPQMNVYVGEQVSFVGGHASPQSACRYIPNLISKEDK